MTDNGPGADFICKNRRKIKWFNEEGYGFIRQNNGGEDVFLHIKNVIVRDSGKILEAGMKVYYAVEVTEKGLTGKAIEVSDRLQTDKPVSIEFRDYDFGLGRLGDLRPMNKIWNFVYLLYNKLKSKTEGVKNA